MNPVLEDAIRTALAERDQGRTDWAYEIADALTVYRESAALPCDLEAIVEELFESCPADTPALDRMVGELLSASPVQADNAIAAIFWKTGREPQPAVIVDWRTPGSTWFVVYDDNSMLDPENTPWCHWEDFLDALYRNTDPAGHTVYITPRSPYGYTLVPVLADLLTRMGYRTEPVPEGT